jgi:hypothetical protein
MNAVEILAAVRGAMLVARNVAKNPREKTKKASVGPTKLSFISASPAFQQGTDQLAESKRILKLQVVAAEEVKLLAAGYVIGFRQPDSG